MLAKSAVGYCCFADRIFSRRSFNIFRRILRESSGRLCRPAFHSMFPASCTERHTIRFIWKSPQVPPFASSAYADGSKADSWYIIAAICQIGSPEVWEALSYRPTGTWFRLFRPGRQHEEYTAYATVLRIFSEFVDWVQRIIFPWNYTKSRKISGKIYDKSRFLFRFCFGFASGMKSS